MANAADDGGGGPEGEVDVFDEAEWDLVLFILSKSVETGNAVHNPVQEVFQGIVGSLGHGQDAEGEGLGIVVVSSGVGEQ